MSHTVARHLNELHRASGNEATDLDKYTRRLLWSRDPLISYRTATTADEQPKIPDPTLFASLTHPATGTPDLPTLGECAVHLELLEAFRTLRVNVIRSSALDTTFGVKILKRNVFSRSRDEKTDKYVMKPAQLQDTTWGTRRRQKWSYFLGIAVGRFKVWMLKMDAFLKASAGLEERTRLPFLPPLDILMVWHAFLLNPHDYDRACRRHNFTCVSTLLFPWTELHAAIDSENWAYNLPQAAACWTKEHAIIEPDLFRYLCQAGKISNSISTALARYGENEAQIFPLGESLNARGLTSRDEAFLTALQQTELDKEANQPLAANVQRQAAFVDKMHAQLWIRSPAVEGTLRRAGDRYEKFLRLLQLCPRHMLVPTLDIDLAWHTHQCSAGVYYASVKRRTGVFLNHDDKLGRPVLQGGLEGTKKQFLMRFGEEYERCLCWDCEAVASALEEASGGAGSTQESVSTLVTKVKEDVHYYRCVELLRRAGQKLPIRTP